MNIATDYETRAAVGRAPHELWTKAGPVVSRLEDEEVRLLEQRASLGVTDSSALGLWGFATGTWMAATVMGGWLPPAAMITAAPVLLVFAGIAQFIAGLYAYRRANALAGTAFCSFGAFNTTVAVWLMLRGVGLFGADADAALMLGFLLISFGFIALALAMAAMRENIALVAVLGTLCVGYVLTGVPDLSGSAGPGIVGEIGGCFLLLSALFAYYAGAAMVVNSAWQRTVLPLGGTA